MFPSNSTVRTASRGVNLTVLFAATVYPGSQHPAYLKLWLSLPATAHGEKHYIVEIVTLCGLRLLTQAIRVHLLRLSWPRKSSVCVVRIETPSDQPAHVSSNRVIHWHRLPGRKVVDEFVTLPAHALVLSHHPVRNHGAGQAFGDFCRMSQQSPRTNTRSPSLSLQRFHHLSVDADSCVSHAFTHRQATTINASTKRMKIARKAADQLGHTAILNGFIRFSDILMQSRHESSAGYQE